MSAIEHELIALRDGDGVLHPEQVVEWAAANPTSALHAAIEWDDAKAAAEHRIWQVRKLIALHIVTAQGERKMVSLTVDRQKGGGYRMAEDVAKAPALRAVLLRDALAELRRARAKYRQISELAKIWDDIDAFDEEDDSAAA